MIHERSGKRDPSVSAIYRESGISVYDVDAEIYFYESNKVAARLEFKHGSVKPDLHPPKYCLCQTCRFTETSNKLEIPFFVVVYFHYDKDGVLLNSEDYGAAMPKQIKAMIKHSQYLVIGMNKFAKENRGFSCKTELEFWQWQRKLTKNPETLDEHSGFSTRWKPCWAWKGL